MEKDLLLKERNTPPTESNTQNDGNKNSLKRLSKEIATLQQSVEQLTEVQKKLQGQESWIAKWALSMARIFTGAIIAAFIFKSTSVSPAELREQVVELQQQVSLLEARNGDLKTLMTALLERVGTQPVVKPEVIVPTLGWELYQDCKWAGEWLALPFKAAWHGLTYAGNGIAHFGHKCFDISILKKAAITAGIITGITATTYCATMIFPNTTGTIINGVTSIFGRRGEQANVGDDNPEGIARILSTFYNPANPTANQAGEPAIGNIITRTLDTIEET